jgi:hypothetical protein
MHIEINGRLENLDSFVGLMTDRMVARFIIGCRHSEPHLELKEINADCGSYNRACKSY